MALKQVILVRSDLKMPKGKMAAQAAHAAVAAAMKSEKRKIKEWQNEGMKKVVLKVKDRKELIKYKNKAEIMGLVSALITDSGRTFFKRATTTCLGIGPDDEEKIDVLTGNLKMV